MLDVPIEFQRKRPALPRQPAVPETVAALEAFASELSTELGNTPRLYQLNRARLALADRHELLRRATPTRSRGRLDDAFNRSYAALFDHALKLDTPELSPPPPAPVAPPIAPPPRPRSVAEAMAEALHDVM